MNYIMGLDIGTTGCKATVFSDEGRVCSKAYREYQTEGYDGTIAPEMIVDYVKETISECAADYPVIEAICTTSFGETVVAVDGKGRALAPAVLYTNSNAEEEWKELDQAVGGDRIFQITGLISHPMYTIGRLMWMKKYQPEIFAKTEKFLFVASYIESCLGADMVAEDTLASRSMAYDVKEGKWSTSILNSAGIPAEKLCRIVRAGEKIGKVSDEICRKLGLKKSPVLIAGGHDQPCVALGMGAIHGGDAAYGMGTVECFTLILDAYEQNSKMRQMNLVCTPHVVPGKYVTYGVLFSGGVVLKELRNKLYAKEREECKRSHADVYELMMQEMPKEEDKLLFLPHLAGSGTPFMDTHDRGGIYGMSLETGRGQIVKAALEGIAFDMRMNLENMLECGLAVKRILTGGGGAKSDLGLQVRANILQRELLAADDVQAGTRGVYYIAAKALGWIADYESSVREFKYHKITPEPEKAETAAEKFQRYLKFYQAVKKI